MKVQESLSSFLYETKKLTLPGIGHFTLDAAINIYEKNDPVLIQQAIKFEADARAAEEDELIQHLVKTTGKMKPLAISDLESFLNTGKQLLNIGKPFILPGIGSIVKSRNELSFTPGQFIPPKLEDKVTEHKLRDKTVDEPNFSSIEKEFDYEEGSRRTSRKWLMILATLLLIALAGWGVYYFLLKKDTTADSNTIVNSETQEAASQDTTSNTPATDSSLLKVKDSLPATPASIAAIPDSINYTYVIELREYKYLKSAEERAAALRTFGNKVFVEPKDSLHFALLFPVNGPLTDTAKVIDSLSAMYLQKDAKRPVVRLK